MSDTLHSGRPGEREAVVPPACLCGATRYRTILSGTYDRLLARDYQFTVEQCLECALARTLPVPDPAQYESGYSLTTDEGRFAGSHADQWSEAIAAYVRARAPGRRFLDVGCHVGNLVAAASAQGFDAEGIDLDPVATQEGRRLGRPVRTATIEEIHGAWDVVVMNHVLEHVLDLRSFLAAIARVLAPEGRLFIFVPHHRGLIPRLMGDHWMAWCPHQHIWHFTPATLVPVVEKASGLRLVSLTTEGAIEPPSRGAKGLVKAGLSAWSRKVGWGDEIEAVFLKPEEALIHG